MKSRIPCVREVLSSQLALMGSETLTFGIIYANVEEKSDEGKGNPSFEKPNSTCLVLKIHSFYVQ